ncbi:MAG: hypothetical protein SNJ67_08850 [Chloracidobacterium sp.]|uniref:Uncharacterized protein n=1 Tax=Chloracidobacterium validum TaxID=2821543 RepID=A0ABX8B7M5_9BACT|nr:hypothetical protein [Chloracidobacterium validum]QUW02952.1 hypothetical protein J8C06_00445 [Chloracidobacterium validum]
MFDLETQAAAPPTTARRTMLLIVAVTFCLVSVAVGLVMWWEKNSRETAAIKMAEGMLRAGAPEFDDYLRREGVSLVTLDRLVINGETSDRYEYVCRIENRGDRTLTGLELRVYLIDMEEKTIAEKLAYPLAAQNVKQLAPGQSITARPTMTGVKTPESEVRDFFCVINGLRFAKP